MRIEQNFIDDIKNIIKAERDSAQAAITFCMAHDYWNVDQQSTKEKYTSVRKTEFGTLLIHELAKSMPDYFLGLDKGFCFVKNQLRFYPEIESPYLDLVFYNHSLHCFVLVTLKTGLLKDIDGRVLDVYLNNFNEQHQDQSDNPTIGVILCINKDETIVEFWAPDDDKQLCDIKLMPYMPDGDALAAEIEGKKRFLEQQLKTTDSQ